MRPPASTLSLTPNAAGRRLLAARSASCVRWELSVASDSTRRAPTRHLSRLLLCTHTHGARDRTTNKRNELPPPHEHLVAEVAKPRERNPDDSIRTAVVSWMHQQ